VDTTRSRSRRIGRSQRRPGEPRGGLGVVGFRAIAIVGLWLALEPALVLASITDPILFLEIAHASSGLTRSSVQLTGSFPESALVELAYPLQVLIHGAGPGDVYVRYDLSNGAWQGSSSLLRGGLSPAEATLLVSEGTSAPDARVLFVGAGRIEVLLPASFPIGDAEAFLFFVDGGGAVVSNPLSLVIPPHVPLPGAGAAQ